MSKSKCAFCNKTLRSGEWMLAKDGDNNVIKVCIDRKSCSNRCVSKGKGLLSFGLHKDVKEAE